MWLRRGAASPRQTEGLLSPTVSSFPSLMVHKRSTAAKEARRASDGAKGYRPPGGDIPANPDPAGTIYALEPLRRALLSLPIHFLVQAARRLREILIEIEGVIAQHNEQ